MPLAYKAHGITEEIVDAMDNSSRYAVRQVAAYFFGFDDGTRIPRACLEKAVMWKLLLARGKEFGEGGRASRAPSPGRI